MYKNTCFLKLFEFIIVIVLFFSIFGCFLEGIRGAEAYPGGFDHWDFIHIFENRITRILGSNPGGLWEDGRFFPFHKKSALFTEPWHGTALLLSPIYIFVKNTNLTLFIGRFLSIFFIWFWTYYFLRTLKATKVSSFYAAAMTCLAVNRTWHPSFLAFFFIPLLGIITAKIFSEKQIYWALLWGILFGYLAWASLHLFVMGGTFLLLFIFWNVFYGKTCQKSLKRLLIAFFISIPIASGMLWPLVSTYREFGFHANPNEAFYYSANFAGLIFVPSDHIPSFFLARTFFWNLLKVSARSESRVGISIFLFIGVFLIAILRLSRASSHSESDRQSARAFVAILLGAIFFASVNILSFIAMYKKHHLVLPNIMVFEMYLSYAFFGFLIYLLRHRIKRSFEHLDFFMVSISILFLFLCFGPYYLMRGGSVFISPITFLQYSVPGFSGIRAVARWGFMLNFSLSIAVAVFLSKSKRFLMKSGAILFMGLSFFWAAPTLLTPQERFHQLKRFGYDFRSIKPFQYQPREVDVFLKNIPDGAVMELDSYPINFAQIHSEHDSGKLNSVLHYSFLSRLYHKKPLVLGYARYSPQVHQENFFYDDLVLSYDTIERLRKFGARYWVLHVHNWPVEKVEALENAVENFEKIAEFNNGKTLVYEDPNPVILVTPFEVLQ